MPVTPSAAVNKALQHQLVATPLLHPSGGPDPNIAWLAYASWDHAFYVATPPSSVEVLQSINQSTRFNVTAIIPVGVSPFDVAVDPSTKQVFVTNSGSANVSVIDGVTQKVTGNITVQADPTGIAFDAANQTLFVSDNGTSNVSVVSVSTLKVIATVHVGADPVGVVWDGATSQVFVANWGAASVSAISETHGKHLVVATIPVGTRPIDVALDNATDRVYVTNQLSNNISVISAALDSLNATVGVMGGWAGGLQGLAYDSVHHIIWVAGGWYNAIAVNTTTESVEGYFSIDPAGAAFDPDNGDVCLTDSANVTFICLAFGIGRASTITFTESGLVHGAVWNASLWAGASTAEKSLTQANVLSTASQIQFGIMNGECVVSPCRYWIGTTSPGQSPIPITGTVSTDTAGNGAVNVTFSRPQGPYPVTFEETGLRSGTNWSVTVNGTSRSSTGISLAFLVPNGTYSYVVGPVSGYARSVVSGTLHVDGGPVQISIQFVSTTTTYSIQFIETGLPRGTAWSVTFFGASNTSTTRVIDFRSGNGSGLNYAVAGVSHYIVSPASGTIDVAGGGVNLTIRFSRIYTVWFNETGLAMGTSWSVRLNGTDARGSTMSLAFQEPNGTYSYSIAPVPGYTTTWKGTAAVIGADLPVPVAWSIVTYAVMFTETGLVSGTSWFVSFAGSPYNPRGSSIFVQVPNGSYSFMVGAVSGYEVNRSSGTVGVDGASTSVALTFTPLTSSSPGATFLGLPASEGYAVVAGIGVVAATAIEAVLIARWRRESP